MLRYSHHFAALEKAKLVRVKSVGELGTDWVLPS